MMNLKTLLVGAIAITSITIPMISLATPVEDSYDGRAEGTVTRPDGDRSEAVIYATADLRRSGEFSLSVRTNRGREMWSGSWRERDNRTATITVTDGFGREIDGKGSAQFVGDRLQTIRLESNTRSDAWRVAVTVTQQNVRERERPSDSVSDEITDRELKLTAVGNMTVLDRRLRVNSVTLKLLRNGDLVLDTKGGYADTFRGTWNVDEQAIREFRITSSRKLGRVSGSGTYVIRGKALRSVEFLTENRDGSVELIMPAGTVDRREGRVGSDTRPDRPDYRIERPVTRDDPNSVLDLGNRSNGTMNVDGMDERITRVALTEDGDSLSIRVYGRRSSRVVQFDVDISSRNSSRVSGDLTRVSTINGRTSGPVTVRYDRAGRVQMLEIRGKVDKRSVSVSFRGD